ncbi:MAG: serine hydrolase, partial [Anaerolineae bacterium]|nr:serine hydrolase [Anaerolineae bacterium]
MFKLRGKLLFVSAVFFLFSLEIASAQQVAPAGSDVLWPMPTWQTTTPAAAGMDSSLLIQARDYALTAGGSGIITRGGQVVMSWGDLTTRYDLKSATKSIGSIALGLAIQDGKMTLGGTAASYNPYFAAQILDSGDPAWVNQITIRQIATQTAGFYKPGYGQGLLFQPGTMWSYSDGGPNWLAQTITVVYQQDLKVLLFNRAFTPMGLTGNDLTWRSNLYFPTSVNGVPVREFGSGISADVDALARIGYLYLREGYWVNQQIIPQSFVDQVRTSVPGVVGLPELTPETHGNASDHYGLFWWNNADGTLANVPRDAYWGWGLNESLIIVIPSLDIVAVRSGTTGWQYPWKPDYNVIRPFIEPIVQSVQTNLAPVIQSVTAVPNTINTGQTSQLTVTATDPDQSPAMLTYHWQILSGGGSLNNSAIASPTYTAPGTGGIVTLQVTVSDGEASVQQ